MSNDKHIDTEPDARIFLQRLKAGPWNATERLEALDRAPRYRPACVAQGSRINPRTGRSESSWKEPESLQGRGAGFLFQHARCDEIRQVVDPSALAEFHAIRAERQRLEDARKALWAREQALVRASFPSAQSVRLVDAKREYAERQATKTEDLS